MTTEGGERIPASPQAMAEALELSGEILADVELDRAPLSSIGLKACRLARILNDFDAQAMFRYETSGYPIVASPEVWALAVAAGRKNRSKDPSTGETNESGNCVNRSTRTDHSYR